jgi:RluA family pseudouridine synthase
MSNPILEHYRDAHLLVVEKPFGLASQPTRDGAKNLYDLLCKQEKYIGMHHRLDTPASGLLLFGLVRGVNRQLAAAFREHQIDRRYQMVVIGNPGPGPGQWSANLDGKTATTHWRVLKTCPGMSLIEARLETGRTHQIRRHAAQAGHPIVGDNRYGGGAARLWKRLALHANSLEFTHPITQKTLRIQCEMPADLHGLLARFDPGK